MGSFTAVRTGLADEFGHTKLFFEGPLCQCGEARLHGNTRGSLRQAARPKLAFLRSRGHHLITQTPTRAFMNHQEPEFNPVLTETDSAKTDESMETTGSEIPANERPSYLRSRQIALKKFTSQGGAPSAG